jgi:hypothetical protein
MTLEDLRSAVEGISWQSESELTNSPGAISMVSAGSGAKVNEVYEKLVGSAGLLTPA